MMVCMVQSDQYRRDFFQHDCRKMVDMELQVTWYSRVVLQYEFHMMVCMEPQSQYMHADTLIFG